ncbi:MAG: toll/interleukin-1 receptor domain-containing protein [Lentisphaeria bacterium]|nr:toll/interleukin-1 receptor domain-containing protein [Lentisphaeria bacterium]
MSADRRNRVFVSYSHEDLPLVEPVVAILQGIADVLWDQTFRYGQGFHRQIELYIAHAHAFVPVVTAASASRGWVHQEIGFAMAHNIPFLPIAVGPDALPGEMIQSIHAIRVPEATPEACRRIVGEQFTAAVLENLVADYEDPERALYQCARETEDRARLLVEYCREVRRLNRFGMVRQAGALTSFHIPREPLLHPTWVKRFGPNHPRSRHHCTWQRKERLAFDEHARGAGFKLIINPTLTYEDYGPEARRVRIQWLLRFLKANDEFPNGYIVTDPCQQVEKSTTIIGDWFTAEAVSAAIGRGYRHTIFTRHAPTVMAAADEFDQEFESLLKPGWTLENCRQKTIEELEALLDSLGGPVVFA